MDNTVSIKEKWISKLDYLSNIGPVDSNICKKVSSKKLSANLKNIIMKVVSIFPQIFQ